MAGDFYYDVQVEHIFVQSLWDNGSIAEFPEKERL